MGGGHEGGTKRIMKYVNFLFGLRRKQNLNVYHMAKVVAVIVSTSYSPIFTLKRDCNRKKVIAKLLRQASHALQLTGNER